jgi:hypothetical protein
MIFLSFSIGQRKEKKEMKKKKLNTPDERSRIAEELEMMKQVLVEKAGKNAKDKKGEHNLRNCICLLVTKHRNMSENTNNCNSIIFIYFQ